MSEFRYLVRRDIRKRVPFSDRWVNELVNRGKFPKPVKLGGKENFWIESEVDEWLAGRFREAGRELPAA